MSTKPTRQTVVSDRPTPIEPHRDEADPVDSTPLEDRLAALAAEVAALTERVAKLEPTTRE